MKKLMFILLAIGIISCYQDTKEDEATAEKGKYKVEYYCSASTDVKIFNNDSGIYETYYNFTEATQYFKVQENEQIDIRFSVRPSTTLIARLYINDIIVKERHFSPSTTFARVGLYYLNYDGYEER